MNTSKALVEKTGSLFEAGKKHKLLSIALLCYVALCSSVGLISCLLRIFNGFFSIFPSLLYSVGYLVFVLLPPFLLIYYLLSKAKKEKIARFSLVLIAVSGIFLLISSPLLTLKTEYFCDITTVIPFGYYPITFIAHVSVLIVALIVFVETRNGLKNILPWFCFVAAILLLASNAYNVAIFIRMIAVHNIPIVVRVIYVVPRVFAALKDPALWLALFVMTKYDLIRFSNNRWNPQTASTTEDLRNLKVLFETNQISEDEYKRRKAIILNTE